MSDSSPTKHDPFTLLSQLEQKHKEIVSRQLLDVRIDGWDNPEIWVRYQPVGHTVVSKARNAAMGGSIGDIVVGRRKQGRRHDPGEEELNANIDLLIEACVGVYAKLADDDGEYSLRPGDPHGGLTKFDQDLAENIGVDEPTARKVVRKLFLKDGTIMVHAGRVMEFSGYAETEAEDEVSGE